MYDTILDFFSNKSYLGNILYLLIHQSDTPAIKCRYF